MWKSEKGSQSEKKRKKYESLIPVLVILQILRLRESPCHSIRSPFTTLFFCQWSESADHTHIHVIFLVCAYVALFRHEELAKLSHLPLQLSHRLRLICSRRTSSSADKHSTTGIRSSAAASADRSFAGSPVRRVWWRIKRGWRRVCCRARSAQRVAAGRRGFACHVLRVSTNIPLR